MTNELTQFQLITIDDLMKTGRIPIPKSTIYRLASQGRIRAYKPGKEWLFDITEVLDDIKIKFGNNYGHNKINEKPNARLFQLVL
jgi:excisionase family DNA binding protein